MVVIGSHGKGEPYRPASFHFQFASRASIWTIPNGGPIPLPHHGLTQQNRSPKACVTLSLVTSRIIRSPAQVFLPDGNSFLNASDPLCDVHIFTLRSSLKQGGVPLGIELYLIIYYFEI